MVEIEGSPPSASPQIWTASQSRSVSGAGGDFGDPETGKPFLLVFRMGPEASDPDGAKGREMRTFGEELVRTATLSRPAASPITSPRSASGGAAGRSS
jgi:hypothetical protein